MNLFQKIAQNPQFKAFMKPLLPGLSPKAQQENIDLYRTAVLLNCYKWHQTNSGQPSPKDVEAFYDSVDKLGNEKVIKKSVQKLIEQQVTNMMQKVDTYTVAIEEIVDRKGRPTSNAKRPRLLDTMGFELDCRESTIPTADEGLFLRGKVFPGTVLGFYPGLVHLEEFSTSSSYMKGLLPDEHFMMIVRPDGHIIDARSANKVPHNPYGLGHKINHAPSGSMPNCLQIPFDFPGDPLNIEAFPHELRKYIPNAYSKPPTILGTTDRSACMHSMVIIAARPLEDNEELFVDYRLNSSAGEVPSWYTPFDVDAAKRRWEDDSPPRSNSSNQAAAISPFSSSRKS